MKLLSVVTVDGTSHQPKQEKKEVVSKNILKEYADSFIGNGWTISSMTGQQFVATKRKDINGLVLFIGVVGLLFYLIPGLLILLVGYAARGTDTQIVTIEDAQKWQTQKKQQAEKMQADVEARKIANEKKIAELEGNPLQLWYKIPNDTRTLLVVVAAITIFIITLVFAKSDNPNKPEIDPGTVEPYKPQISVSNGQIKGSKHRFWLASQASFG